jgi:hypothetical protein
MLRSSGLVLGLDQTTLSVRALAYDFLAIYLVADSSRKPSYLLGFLFPATLTVRYAGLW